VTAIVRDVSERKALEDDRRRSEARYRLLAEQARDMIYRIRLAPPPPRVDYMGPAATGLTGFSPEDHYADPDLFLRMTDPDHRQLFERLMADPDSIPNPFMTQIHRRDGVVIWLEHQFTVIRNDVGPIAVEAIARDTTARVLLEEERQRLRAEMEMQDDRERIAQDLHDGVMQALYGIGLNLTHLRTQAKVPEIGVGLDDTVVTLNGVINDIRSYVLDLPGEHVQGALQEQLEKIVAEIAGLSALAVTVSVEDEVPPLSEEQTHAIMQTAREALSNTVRHAQANGAHVSLGREPRGVLLQVRDDGRGFDPHEAVSRDHLGLRNMHARAQSLRGDLEIESAPDAGTVVRLLVRLS
jgi:PAS domain S-box-containing protein